MELAQLSSLKNGDIIVNIRLAAKHPCYNNPIGKVQISHYGTFVDWFDFDQEPSKVNIENYKEEDIKALYIIEQVDSVVYEKYHNVINKILEHNSKRRIFTEIKNIINEELSYLDAYEIFSETQTNLTEYLIVYLNTVLRKIDSLETEMMKR